MSLESAQELNEVLGDGLLLLEESILDVVVLEAVSIILLIMRGHDMNDPFDVWHVQLLVESVESRVSLSPVLGFTLRGFGCLGLSIFTVHGFFNGLCPLFLKSVKIG